MDIALSCMPSTGYMLSSTLTRIVVHSKGVGVAYKVMSSINYPRQQWSGFATEFKY